jgi:hypothetical protein
MAPIFYILRIREVDHDVAAAFCAEQMRLALLPEEVRLQLGFGVAQEFDVATFWVEEQVAWQTDKFALVCEGWFDVGGVGGRL